MHLTRRDLFATLFVVAGLVVYAMWATGAALSGVSTRVLSAVVFGLGWAGCVANKDGMMSALGVDPSVRRPPVGYVVLTSMLGATALVTGILAIALGSETMLAVLVASIAGLWIVSTIRHAVSDQAPVTRPA
jgi:hypothetical protein